MPLPSRYWRPRLDLRYRLVPESEAGHEGGEGRDLPTHELVFLRMCGIHLRLCIQDAVAGVQKLHPPMGSGRIDHEADYAAIVHLLGRE